MSIYDFKVINIYEEEDQLSLSEVVKYVHTPSCVVQCDLL